MRLVWAGLATITLGFLLGRLEPRRAGTGTQYRASAARLRTDRVGGNGAGSENVPGADGLASFSDPRAAAPGAPGLDFASHARLLHARTPAGFTVVVQPPFVVIGDEPAATVRRRATDTVQWAVDRLKRDFFARDPADIIDIWLFRDEQSYEKHTQLLFGEKPTTPFGYYSARHKALIMNIATGGGTLVHEIVHPFMHANFPDCAAWFNEGLGSLYEQCADRDGHIRGQTNWRLAGLQKSIKAGGVPTFAALTAMSDDEFYSHDRGTNYAQARYLCYYLQEKGLLVKFYRQFAAHHEADPTGLETLRSVLGQRDMAAFQTTWDAFVMDLLFP